MLTLPRNLAALSKVAARLETSRYTMNGVLVQETAEGYQVIASDGRRLAVVQGPGRSEELPQEAKGAVKPEVEQKVE